jgi:hypothetical protein
VRAVVLADIVVPYIEVRCAPNRIVKLFGRGPNGVAPILAGARGQKEVFHDAYCAFSSCWRTYLGNVFGPKSLAKFELVWSALLNILGQAIDRIRDEQSEEVISPAPTT